MKRILLSIALAVIIGSAIWVGNFYWKNLRGIGPVIKPTPEDIAEVINTTGMPLKLPPGFSIEIFTDNLPAARVMTFDALGNMWVSQTKEGQVSLLEIENGKVKAVQPIFTRLRNPHGLMFGTGEEQLMLYIAEEHRVSRVPVYSEGDLEKLVDLPSGGGHFTRTIMWLPGFENQKMLISVGSSCNVCNESDSRRAKILIYDLKTKELETFATGLRNSVFIATHPVTGEIWGTEMGRDLLGDDIPPDEINIINQGSPSTPLRVKNFGWPTCYGKNILDTDFHKDDHVHIRPDCSEPFELPSYIDIPAHSAPLGLAFIPARQNPPPADLGGQASGWPEDYWHDLLVAYHGSWNRSVPTGYKIVRYKLDAQGKFEGVDSTNSPQVEDFITGWLENNEALGRPVDILIQPGGIIYISDDKAGVIYRVTYNQQI